MKYIVEDVRNPIGYGNKIIAHCCNDLGIIGAGVALAIVTKWPIVKKKYVDWYSEESENSKSKYFLPLGKVQYIKVESDIVVANIIGQHLIGVDQDGNPPVRYHALKDGCMSIEQIAKKHNASVHFPYLMGCDLAGGKWEVVEEIIKETLVDQGIEVVIYDKFNKRN